MSSGQLTLARFLANLVRYIEMETESKRKSASPITAAGTGRSRAQSNGQMCSTKEIPSRPATPILDADDILHDFRYYTWHDEYVKKINSLVLHN